MPLSVTPVVVCSLLPAPPSCPSTPWKHPSGPIQLHLDLGKALAPRLYPTQCLGPPVFAEETQEGTTAAKAEKAAKEEKKSDKEKKKSETDKESN